MDSTVPNKAEDLEREANEKSVSVQDVLDKHTKEAKALVKSLLEAQRQDHLDAADELNGLLVEIDTASPFLLRRWADVADWDPAAGPYQTSDAAMRVYSLKPWAYFDGLDRFLHDEATQLLNARERRLDEAEARHQRRRGRGREVEAA